MLGHELWELLGSERVEADRRAGIPESMLAFHLLPVLAGALAELVPRHDADSVWLSGGLACLEGFELLMEQASAVLSCPVYVAEDPRFAPVRAGLRLLEPLHSTSPVALDVGQTSIKCASPTALRVFERDTAALPLRLIGMPRPEDGHHIPAAVRFIGGALRAFVEQGGSRPPETRHEATSQDTRSGAEPPHAHREATAQNTQSRATSPHAQHGATVQGRQSGALPPRAQHGATAQGRQSGALPPHAQHGATAHHGAATPDALCLALPCPLDGTLIPGGCTYGWEGHASLVDDLLHASGLTGPEGGGTVLVLNDAELAAEAARWDARLADHRRVLCLTLGFGPGGALLVRD
ncbi:ROK family protein [Pyxidicoccus sp. 3LFB2]